MENKGFNVTQGMVLLLLKPLDLPSNFALNLIIYITNPKNGIGYEWKKLIKFQSKERFSLQIYIPQDTSKIVNIFYINI